MRFAKQIAIVASVFLWASIPVEAQDFSGLSSGNWAGIQNLHVNAANVVDHRYKVDVNLFSVHMNVMNDYLGMRKEPVLNPGLFNEYNYNDFDSLYLVRDTIGNKQLLTSTRLQLPSFMFQITPKDGIGISTNYRVMANIGSISEDIAQLVNNSMRKSFSATSLGSFSENLASFLFQGAVNNNYTVDFDNSFANTLAASWMDIGLHYGRVAIDQKQHFLKAGVALKFLLGVNAGYGYMDGAYAQFNADSSQLSALRGRLMYGESNNAISSGGYNPFNFTGFGLGLDLGLVYEWRPKYAKYQYNMDGKTGLWRRDKEKYTLRVGLGLNDLGSIRFRHSDSSVSYRYTVDVQNIPVSDFDGVSNLDEFLAELETKPGVVRELAPETFTVGLPTTFTATIDWQIVDRVFLNVTPVISLTNNGYGNFNLHNMSSVTGVIRYESPWFGAYLPVSWNPLTQFNAGLALRAGPLFIGSGSLLSWLVKDYSTGVDFYFGVKVPIPHLAPRDRDNDQVSDRKDNCPEKPGVWEFKGCPDSDGDGIADAVDECPFEAGVRAFKGCPDTDGDGVKDADDECPNEAGPSALKGCPDKDSDGIADRNDACPEVKGIALFKGCPDTDKDSIPDSEDACPELAGPKENQGCPDSDGDGVYDNVDKCPTVSGLRELEGCPYADTDGDGVKDKDDKCPNEKGPAENNGCPYSDTDGDGIIDLEDKCPNTPGIKEKDGCPPISKEDQEVLNKAFDNLEFETGKAIIRSSSNSSLDELADLFKAKPKFMLLIEGHTDNVGSRSSNLTLSKNRAAAVKLYLQKKGIEGSRLIVKHYGPDKPIADNSTEEGRQRNRRVEMTVIFE